LPVKLSQATGHSDGRRLGAFAPGARRQAAFMVPSTYRRRPACPSSAATRLPYWTSPGCPPGCPSSRRSARERLSPCQGSETRLTPRATPRRWSSAAGRRGRWRP
jgi:hypothetical protein